jgi:hypothetical protein
MIVLAWCCSRHQDETLARDFVAHYIICAARRSAEDFVQVAGRIPAASAMRSTDKVESRR